MSAPLNILWLTCDEMKASALPTHGNAFTSMPAVDRLAREGVVFENTFCQIPKCVPSRCSMLTGRYPHVDGFRTLRGRTCAPPFADTEENDMVALYEDTPNLIPLVRQAGYRTCLLGKNHIVEWNLHRKWFDQTPSWDFERVPKLEPREDMLRASYAGSVPRDFPLDRHFDAVTASEAIDFIRGSNDRPFFGLVDMSLPHPSYHEFPTMPAAGIPLADIPDAPVAKLEEAPFVERCLRESKDLEHLSAEDRRRIIRAYYSMCEFADRQVGRILDALDESGFAENTLVIFTSDHGDFAAEHGCYEKWDTAFYDCITHVPLILRLPGRFPAGRRVRAMVELVDLMPTVCELARIPVPGYVQGKSLLPVAGGTTDEHREFAFCEGGVEPELAQRAAPAGTSGTDPAKQQVLVRFPEALFRAKMIRTEHYKYVYRIAGGCEFYDLKVDPDELVNRIDDPLMADEILRMKDRLLRHLVESESKMPEIGMCFA